MKTPSRNGFTTAVALSSGFLLGVLSDRALIAPVQAPVETVRILRMGAVLEQCGATSDLFQDAAWLIDNGMAKEAEKKLQQKRLNQ
jgi:hypothetical protein